MKTNTGEPTRYTGIESITVLELGRAEEESEESGMPDYENTLSPVAKDRVMGYTCYNTLPAKNNILEMIG